MIKALRSVIGMMLVLVALVTHAQKTNYNELHRPQLHFSPAASWMNDPNGLVFAGNQWHLFFQHYPKDIVWGPMHWGHAVSPDLVHWKELPIALYPDSAGYIFSGSAVVDSDNTAGFATKGEVPLVAIYTLHDPEGDKAGRNDFETQAIAYSLDNGATWKKYAGNPVLKNPGIRDFRDPKVMWLKDQHKWILTLAAQDHISFYSSLNLKDWKFESDFGKTEGVHDNVWECPDLFPLTYNGKEYWILLVNISGHGPNNGSGTQYFIGQFNGSAFTPLDQKIRWVDYGPDNYAGVTWNNSGKRRIFIGWMSNSSYAGSVPTHPWRSALTVPRELLLTKTDGTLMMTSKPVDEILKSPSVVYKLKVAPASVNLTKRTGGTALPCLISFKTKGRKSFSFEFSNAKNEKVIVGYSSNTNQYFVDRSKSGNMDFSKSFTPNVTAPRIDPSSDGDVTIIADRSSVEIFADNGLSVLTATFFPTEEFTQVIFNNEQSKLAEIQIGPFDSIWAKP